MASHKCRVSAGGGKKSTGFTLIELLVVIAIIALLVSILMPSLRLAKLLTYDAMCQSNLKNLMTQMLVYISESDGRFPFTSRYVDGLSADGIEYPPDEDIWHAPSGWGHHLIKAGAPEKMFMCPLHNPRDAEEIHRSYAINGRVAPDQGPWNPDNAADWPFSRPWTVRITDIADPRTATLAEQWYDVNKSWGHGWLYLDPDVGAYSSLSLAGACWSEPWSYDDMTLTHLDDHVNCAFADGSAGPVTPEMTNGDGFSEVVTDLPGAGSLIHCYATLPEGTTLHGSWLAASIWTPEAND